MQNEQLAQQPIVSSDISRGERSALKSLEKEAHRQERTILKDKKKLQKAEKKLLKDEKKHKTGKLIQKDQAIIREAERELNYDLAKYEQIEAKIHAVAVHDQYAAPVLHEPVSSDLSTPITSSGPVLPATSLSREALEERNRGNSGEIIETVKEIRTTNGGSGCGDLGNREGANEVVVRRIYENDDKLGRSGECPLESARILRQVDSGPEVAQKLDNAPTGGVPMPGMTGQQPLQQQPLGSAPMQSMMQPPFGAPLQQQPGIPLQQQPGMQQPGPGGVIRETVNTTTTTITTGPPQQGIAGIQKGAPPAGFTQGPPLNGREEVRPIS